MPELAEKREPKYGRILGDTFMVSYLVLFGYASITIIEAIRTPHPYVRHIMNIETAVSMVAGLVYGMFMEHYKRPNFSIKDVMPLRYLDWSITTPLILLTVILFYNHTRGTADWKVFACIVALDWAMLYAGYLGETRHIDKWLGFGVSCAFFIAMLWLLWTMSYNHGESMVVFWAITIIWSFYAIAYLLEEEEKNIIYNILDIFSKAIFGVILWMYFVKALAFKG